VIDWRDRCQAGGIAALEDQSRSGRPAEIEEIRVVVATLADNGRPGWGLPTGRLKNYCTRH
jgi:transposase